MKTKVLILALLSILLVGNTVAFAEQGDGKFSDVPSSHWAKSAIEWGVQNKIVSGYSDGTFKPNATVTEAEFLSMLFNVFGGVEKIANEFTPTAADWIIEQIMDGFNLRIKDKWSIPLYTQAARLGYDNLSGKSNEKINRLSIAELLTQIQGIKFKGEVAIKYVLGQGLLNGKGTEPSMDQFYPASNVTRAEAIQVIKNVKDRGKLELKESPLYPSSLDILEDLPIKVIGKTMAEKISDLLVGTKYIAELSANDLQTVLISDTTKSKILKYHLPGIPDRIVYKSVVHYQDMRSEEGRIAIVHGYWAGLEPANDTYDYVEKVLKLLDIPNTDKIIKGIKSRYKDGKFNEHNQLTYDEKIGSYNISYILSTNEDYGFGIFVDK